MKDLELDTVDFMDDDDDDSFIHDEDSDYPNSIIDDEPELDYEEAIMQDIIQTTLSDLEDAIDVAGVVEEITLGKATALKALQLLKAYTTLYQIDYNDYCYDYD